LLAKKKGSTGVTGTCTALIFSLRLSGGLTRIQLYIFCSKSWLMVNGLCFVALPYPSSKFMINDLVVIFVHFAAKNIQFAIFNFRFQLVRIRIYGG
jgi:hypothetical protein